MRRVIKKKERKKRELSIYGMIKIIVLLIDKNIIEAVERNHNESSYHALLT